MVLTFVIAVQRQGIPINNPNQITSPKTEKLFYPKQMGELMLLKEMGYILGNKEPSVHCLKYQISTKEAVVHIL